MEKALTVPGSFVSAQSHSLRDSWAQSIWAMPVDGWVSRYSAPVPGLFWAPPPGVLSLSLPGNSPGSEGTDQGTPE